MSARQGYAEVSRLPKPFLSSIVNRKSFNEELARRLCREKRLEAAIDVVVCLVDYQKVRVSKDILYRLLQGCIHKKCLTLGRKVHQLIKRSHFTSDTFLGSHLICMFGECGSITEASQVFKELPDTTVYTWSALISAHAKLDQGEEAVRLFAVMQHCSGICPNAYTFVAVLKACASIPALLQGRLVHSFAIEWSLDSDLHLCNTLVDMYAKGNSLSNAHVIFDRLVKKSQVTWNAMISGYAQHGHGVEAFHVFQAMLRGRELPDKVTFMSVLKACPYAEEPYALGRLVHVFVVEMEYDKDDYLQSSLIDMYTKCGILQELRMFLTVSKSSRVSSHGMRLLQDVLIKAGLTRHCGCLDLCKSQVYCQT